MKYMVTGGAGFLGSNLCSAIVKRGDVVWCVDNLLTSTGRNIEHLRGNPSFVYVEADVLNVEEVGGMDGIFHLASPAAPGMIQKYPDDTFIVNGQGTQKMKALADSLGAKFLYASSMKVYGECSRVQPYIDGKRTGEAYCGETGKIARLGSVYGPGMDPNDSRVIPQYITRALRGEPLILWNTGAQIDSFCYVDDIVGFLLAFMDCDFGGTIEAGDPFGVTIRGLAEIIIEMTGSSSIFEYRDVQVSPECHMMPDTVLAEEFLGWIPYTGLREGLAKTIEYFRNL